MRLVLARWFRLLRRLCQARIDTRSEFGTLRRQLLIDVSLICRNDAGTGIQRVVRNICAHLLDNPPVGFNVVPVASIDGKPYAALTPNAAFGDGQYPVDKLQLALNVAAGDVFLALDLAPRVVNKRLLELMRWRRQGVKIHFVLYDMLPALHPQWFNDVSTRHFKRWLRTLAIVADGVVCPSRVTADAFATWLWQMYGMQPDEIPRSIIRLGSDMSKRVLSSSDDAASAVAIEHVPSQPFVLMVGTLEPRKAHAEILETFESLWTMGESCALVIAGKAGWKVDALIAEISSHPESGKRLFWIDTPSDGWLEQLYISCSGLIMASKGEGFGLPVAEAQHHGKPIFARDIPIFRETASEDGVTYFPDGSQQIMLEQLKHWLSGLADRSINGPKIYQPTSWALTCQQLLDALALNRSVST